MLTSERIRVAFVFKSYFYSESKASVKLQILKRAFQTYMVELILAFLCMETSTS